MTTKPVSAAASHDYLTNQEMDDMHDDLDEALRKPAVSAAALRASEQILAKFGKVHEHWAVTCAEIIDSCFQEERKELVEAAREFRRVFPHKDVMECGNEEQRIASGVLEAALSKVIR